MRLQLRVYRAKPGELNAFVSEWREHVAPLRRRFGFHVVEAWRGEDGESFVWLLGYDGETTFEEADARYYNSPERRALDPDPARHLAEASTRFVTPLA